MTKLTLHLSHASNYKQAFNVAHPYSPPIELHFVAVFVIILVMLENMSMPQFQAVVCVSAYV